MNNEQNQTITSNTTLRYAGFGSRLGAYLIDGLVLFVIAAILFAILVFSSIFLKPTGGMKVVVLFLQYVLTILICLLGMPLYRGIKDPKGKTLGRKVTKTILVNEDGSEVSVGMSFLRQLLRSLISSVGITVIVDFILILTDEKSQTLADKILKTVVVYK